MAQQDSFLASESILDEGPSWGEKVCTQDPKTDSLWKVWAGKLSALQGTELNWAPG